MCLLFVVWIIHMLSYDVFPQPNQTFITKKLNLLISHDVGRKQHAHGVTRCLNHTLVNINLIAKHCDKLCA